MFPFHRTSEVDSVYLKFPFYFHERDFMVGGFEKFGLLFNTVFFKKNLI